MRYCGAGFVSGRSTLVRPLRKFFYCISVMREPKPAVIVSSSEL
jgi:hypothetical protein